MIGSNKIYLISRQVVSVMLNMGFGVFYHLHPTLRLYSNENKIIVAIKHRLTD